MRDLRRGTKRQTVGRCTHVIWHAAFKRALSLNVNKIFSGPQLPTLGSRERQLPTLPSPGMSAAPAAHRLSGPGAAAAMSAHTQARTPPAVDMQIVFCEKFCMSLNS